MRRERGLRCVGCGGCGGGEGEKCGSLVVEPGVGIRSKLPKFRVRDGMGFRKLARIVEPRSYFLRA